MSVSIHTRRLASGCFFCRPLAIRSKPPLLQQRRAASDDQNNQPSNPVLEEWRKANPGKGNDALAEEQRKQALAQRTPGDISAGSIFEDQRREQQQERREAKAQSTPKGSLVTVAGRERNLAYMQNVLDTHPQARERYQKKKVVQLVRRRGRLTKRQFEQRTEREFKVQSRNMKTSVKKLGMLARQIAGKPIEEAIIQMRFSKKKVAIEVRKHLEAARDKAIVTRGMGLGAVKLEPGAPILNGADGTLTQLNAPQSTSGEPIEIQLKDGKRHKVQDRSTIYIEQAWVGRGLYGRLPDMRARGRMFVMKTPWTRLGLILKEEHTRIRQHEEREEKRKKQVLNKVWTQLPDRPVQWQRQWYTF